jgi:signal peptidase I
MTTQNSGDTKKNSWDETIKTILIALLLAVTFRSVAFEPFHIPTGSMKDNLLVGDYLFVSKYSYGYSRFSFPFGIPLFEGRVLELSQPKRGDVVVFRLPVNTRIDYIKRIIGMPGDNIQIKEGIVYINGEPLKREQKTDFVDDEKKDNIKSIARFSEALPEGRMIEILKEHKKGPADNTQIYQVPAGHYFMMGDNRDNSHDSRYLDDVGYVPYENIVGHAQIIFFSTNGTAQLKNPLSWFSAIRTDRLFKMIE